MAVQVTRQDVTRSIDKVTSIIITQFIGLSTDVKPIDCNRGSQFEETDTGNVYKFDGANWYFTTQGSTNVAPDGTPYNTNLSLFDHENYDGKVFTFSKTNVNVANNGYFDVHIKAGSKPVYFEIYYGSEGKSYFKTYLNTVYSNQGTLRSVYPRNTASTFTLTSTIYETPTVTTLGSPRGNDFIGSGSRGTPSKAGGTGANTGSILKSGDDLLIRLQNVSGNASDLNIIINLLEF